MTEEEDAKIEVGRVAHRLTERGKRERVLVIAVVIFACISTYGIIQNRSLAVHLKNTITTGRASRLADQARTDSEIRALACFFVEGIPDSYGNGRAGKFRKLYGCPAYTKTGATASSPQPTPTKTIVLPGGIVTDTMTVTVPVPDPVPGPTVTRIRTRTKTVPAPRPTVCVGKVCVTLPVK